MIPRLIDRFLMRPRYQMPLILLGWGWWIAGVRAFESSGIYREMSRFGDEWQWGLLFGAVGVLALGGATWATRRPLSRRAIVCEALGSAATTACWLFIVLLLMMVNWRSTATYIYGCVFAISLLSFLDITNIVRWRCVQSGDC